MTSLPVRLTSSHALVLGLRSAVACVVLSLAYVVGQVGEWLGMLGSGGGASIRSTPMGIAVLLTRSLLLAPAFLFMILAIHGITARGRQVYSHAAIAFATMYATLVSTLASVWAVTFPTAAWATALVFRAAETGRS